MKNNNLTNAVALFCFSALTFAANLLAANDAYETFMESQEMELLMTDNSSDTGSSLVTVDASGRLLIFSMDNLNEPVIIFDPNPDAPSISIAGKRVLLEDNSNHISLLNVSSYEPPILYDMPMEGKTAYGIGAVASGSNSTAFGASALATNNETVAYGFASVAAGSSSSAYGSWTWADGESSSVFGAHSSAYAQYSSVFGTGSQAEGEYAIILGANSYVAGMRSIAIGSQLRILHANQIAIGSYNDSSDANILFMLGNGTAANARSNALTVMKTGEMRLQHKDYIVPTEEEPNPEQPTALSVKGSVNVNGSINVDGVLRVKPAGDIPMGDFIAGDI